MNIVASSANEFQSNRLDAYYLRVVQASQFISIALSSDLTDEDGNVLISKSSSLNEFTARRFFNKTIQQDLSKVFHCTNSIQWSELHQDLVDVLRDDEFLSRINAHFDLTQLIAPLINSFSNCESAADLCLDPNTISEPHTATGGALASKNKLDGDFLFRLTILKLICRETYTRTLLCTWLSILLVKDMRLTDSDLRVVFIASLAHDLGMLHVSNEILGSDDSISATEWLELQQHVPKSAAIVRQAFKDSELIALAIEEHHERCDGTGYPYGKVESELSFAGKILALSDSVIAIFRNRFDSKRHSWRDVIPVIQMNAQAYFYRHADILGNLWRRAEVPTNRVVNVDEVQNFVHQLQFQHGRTLAWFNCLTKRILSLGFTHGDRKLHAMQNVALHLATSTKGIGIFNDEFMEWLENLSVTDYETHAIKIQDAYVKLQEVISHLQKLTRMLKISVDDQLLKDKKIEKELLGLVEEIKKILGS